MLTKKQTVQTDQTDQTDQTTSANKTSIFEDRRKSEDINNFNPTSALPSRRQSNFDNGETWYLRVSIKNSI